MKTISTGRNMVRLSELKLSLLLVIGYLALAAVSSAQPTSQPKRSSMPGKTEGSAAPSAGPTKYGYPYLVAPTLAPLINSRVDEYDKETSFVAKPFGSKLFSASEEAAKKLPKKYKPGLIYGASRRGGYNAGDSLIFKKLRGYKEPKYRNFEELESAFRPRRIDLSEHYAGHNYPSKPAEGRPPVSPRDPYLSPSGGHGEGFYPMTDVKSYSSPYGSSGPVYGAGKYDEPYYDGHGSYDPSAYSGPPKYPTSSHYHEYQEDYAIESNKPITGDVRKRLLDYAGASDFYEGEPDYLQEVARNKNKYGYAANDYYAYGGPGYRSSYREYPYVKSKIRIIKKTI